MRSLPIVEVEVAANRDARLTDAVVGPEMGLLVFDAAPQPLDEHVISPSSFSEDLATALKIDAEASEGHLKA